MNEQIHNSAPASLRSAAKELTANDSRAVDGVDNLPTPQPLIENQKEVVAIYRSAFTQSLLGYDPLLPHQGTSTLWNKTPSIVSALCYNIAMLGPVKRDYGDIWDYTHHMEVVHSVYNCPDLKSYNQEYSSFLSVTHDYEDISKKRGLAPLLVMNEAMSHLEKDCSFLAEAKRNFWLLMDPPDVVGTDRRDLQIARVKDMAVVAKYVRFFDKYCTYRRDLHNMQTRDASGNRLYNFASLEDAERYLKKMDNKAMVVSALCDPRAPHNVDSRYMMAWEMQRKNITHEIGDILCEHGIENHYHDPLQTQVIPRLSSPAIAASAGNSLETADASPRSFFRAAGDAFALVVTTARTRGLQAGLAIRSLVL